MIDLDAIVNASFDLAPLPATVQRLAEVLRDPEIDLRRVADVVALDEALTGRVLRTANSALYAGHLPCTTIRGAIVRLGSGVTLSFAIGAGVKGPMLRPVPEYGLVEGALWRHSVAAALAATLIRTRVRCVNVPDEVYSAALLHDIGKLVLARYLSPEARQPLVDARRRGDLSQIEAETLVLGVHHGELGEVICRRWRLPATISLPIRYSHQVDDARALMSGIPDATVVGVVCDVVALADAIACESYPADCGEEPGGVFDPAVAARLGLVRDDFEALVVATRDKFEETLALYG